MFILCFANGMVLKYFVILVQLTTIRKNKEMA